MAIPLAFGEMPLRKRIAGHYDEFYGHSVSADRIVITPGSSLGFALAFWQRLTEETGLRLPHPATQHRNLMVSLGIEPVLMPARADEGWMPSLKALAELASHFRTEFCWQARQIRLAW